jgi:hypothetical protein
MLTSGTRNLPRRRPRLGSAVWGGFDFADRCQSWVSVPKARPASLREALRAGPSGQVFHKIKKRVKE